MNIKQLLSRRILILDGAMGTLIQRHKLTEEQFRGERFKNVAKPQRGNNDLLPLRNRNNFRYSPTISSVGAI